jgi:O-antigen ligase/cytochrome c-type biogenesis protein CcmH/NrfG
MGGSRVGVWVLAALAPLAVLALDPGGWYPFGPVKWLVISALVPAGAALVWTGRAVRANRVQLIALGVLLAVLALAAAFGTDGRYAWLGTPERQFGVLTWALAAVALVAGQSLDAERDGRPIAVGLVVAGLGAGAAATAEGLGWRAGPIGLGGDRLTGTLGSAAYLGAAGALLLPALTGVAADGRFARWVRVAAAVGTGLLAVTLVGAGARAAWVGLLVAGLVLAVAERRRIAAHLRIALLVGAAGIAALVVVAAVSPAGERAAAVLDADAPGGRGRVDEWRVGARVAARHPVHGVGPEGYRIAFADGVDASYQRAHGRDPLPDRAHSGPLDVALAGGLVALAAWAVVMAVSVRAAWRAMGGGRPWLAGLGAGLVAHLAGQLLLFPTFELEPVSWLLAGLLVAATARRDELVERDRVPGLVPVLAVVAAAAVVAGGFGVAADREAARAADALSAGEGPVAVEAATRATELRPDVLRYHLLLARALVADDRGTVAALAAADDALEQSPGDPVAQRERARLLVARAAATSVPAHVTAAQRELRGLLADDPVNADLWRLLGEADVLAGDPTAAEQAWRRAEHLAPRDPGPPADLAELYLAVDRPEAARRAAGRALALDPADQRAQAVLRRARGS